MVTATRSGRMADGGLRFIVVTTPAIKSVVPTCGVMIIPIMAKNIVFLGYQIIIFVLLVIPQYLVIVNNIISLRNKFIKLK